MLLSIWMSNQTITIGKISINAPAMNAAGPWAATKKQLELIYKSQSAAVVTKSFSLKPNPGNPKPNTYFEKDFSLNSVGLENNGADYFIDAVSNFKKTKPLIASLVGFETNEFKELLSKVNNSNFDLIELNLSCPNVKSEEPLGYSPQAVDDILKITTKLSKKPVSVKLPPYYSRQQINKVGTVLLNHNLNHVVLINTLPIATVVNKGKAAITPNDGIGGLGGRYIKPIGLAHVKIFSEHLKGKLPIVGVGGINTKKDITEYLDLGASAVQIGSAIENQGLKIFTELN